MNERAAIRSTGRWHPALLLFAVLVLAGAPARAGSPLTLSIMQDGSVKATQLDVSYARHVKCEKPGLPPEVKIVTEKGTLHLGGKKSFYISELKVDDKSQHVCFMPEHTVTMTTGGDMQAEQTVPAQTWGQTSQRLDVQRVSASIDGIRVAVASDCMGGGKLDTESDQKVLTFRQTGALAGAAKGGKPGSGKLGGGDDVQVQLTCEVTP